MGLSVRSMAAAAAGVDTDDVLDLGLGLGRGGGGGGGGRGRGRPPDICAASLRCRSKISRSLEDDDIFAVILFGNDVLQFLLHVLYLSMTRRSEFWRIFQRTLGKKYYAWHLADDVGKVEYLKNRMEFFARSSQRRQTINRASTWYDCSGPIIALLKSRFSQLNVPFFAHPGPRVLLVVEVS